MNASGRIVPPVGNRENVMATTVKTCECCGNAFYAGKKNAKYCSGACRSAAYRARVTAPETVKKLNLPYRGLALMVEQHSKNAGEYMMQIAETGDKAALLSALQMLEYFLVDTGLMSADDIQVIIDDNIKALTGQMSLLTHGAQK